MTTRNSSIARAMRSLEAAIPRAASDPARPAFHFRPPAQWMNDPNGVIHYNGYYHLFYQHNPYSDQWGDIHWGHARSKDLTHWEHLPIALWPSAEMDEAHCFSGCAYINKAGEPMLFYTKVSPGQRETRRNNEQWAALGDAEMMNFRKHPENPILSLVTHGGPPFDRDWRDPFIFVESGRTFMVLGGTYGEKAAIALYETADPAAVHWRFRRVLYEQPRSEVSFFECPNFFKVQDRWVLLYSPYRQIEYLTGSFNLDNLSFSPKRKGILDYGAGGETTANFYASNVMFDPLGRCILFGWVRGFPTGKGWNGCLALPRVLTVDMDGQPRQAPVAELATLRTEHRSVTNVALSGEPFVVPELSGDMLEVVATVALDEGSTVTLTIAGTEGSVGAASGAAPVEISVTRDTLIVAGAEAPLESVNGSVTLQAFLDKSVLEVFANNGRTVVTRVVDAPGEQAQIRIAAAGGATLTRLDGWRIKSIW